MFCLASTTVFGQCTLSSPTTWTDGNGNWSVAGNWSGGVPTSSTNTCITDGTSTVTLDVSGSTADLQLASGNILNFDPGTILSVFGTQIINAGQININSGGGQNAVLELENNVTLSGAGTLTLANTGGGGTAIIYQAAGGLTLTNQSTIQGAGIIGFNGLSLINQGTVDANASGQTLLLESITNGINNAGGLLQASNGGTLLFDGITVGGGGTITATTGGTVQFIGNTDIVGGILNNIGGTLGTLNGNAATLDGSTVAGAITINGTYTNGEGSTTAILGTINNKNNFQLNSGSGSNSVLELGSNVTLQGGGTVTMSNSGGGGSAIIDQAAGGLTLTNVDNTIQGAGIIGFNGLTVVNEATINANSSGQTLYLESITGGLTNTAILEASNGGTLYIDGVTVNNAGGGTITANAGSTVQLLGNTTIQGGTLTNNGSFFGTPAGNSAILDGSTAAGAITINGTYTNDNGSTTYVLGTINNNNNFLVTATGNGNNSELLIDSANVTLQGGGTVTLSTGSGGGNALLLQAAGGLILTNVDNTIQGEGIIGFNGLTLVNEVGGTINANSMGGLQITTLTIESAQVTNQGLMEATNNGGLNIDGVTVNNQGGTISANGAGASVQLFGLADIQGWTLTNNGAAFFGTPNGNVAVLDGSTVSGAVTINGTYTNGNNSTTYLLGTINNQGNIQVNGGSGNNSILEIDTANVTLTGGGTVTLSTAGGGGSAYIDQASGGFVLENFNNTIQGAGIIGLNGLSLLNDVGGTVLANAPGQTLSITSAGTVTNDGTFQANSGSTLLVGTVTSFTNFSGNTLTGGTYNVYGTTSSPGTLQINPLGTTGGEIVNNAATILLNGSNSNFVDQAGLDALSNFSNNMAAGSFTIQSGRNFTSPSSFANAGVVNVGTGSTFTTGGSGNYNQSAGSTKVDGALTAGGGHATFNGGTLLGNGGTITGNVSMSGTISPGDTPGAAGALGIAGNYAQLAAGVFQLELGGLTAGTQFDLLNVTGTTSLSGTLDISLINAFFPNVGDTFTFITSGGLVSGIFGTVNGLNIGGGEVLQVVYNANNVQISTLSLAPVNDYWNGSTGNWSNNPQWSLGTSPGINNNAIIYSGGNDPVTLDIGSGSVNQLNLGGASNGFTSELTDGGTAQNLTIIQGLSIGANGFLNLTGASTITSATMGNSGYLYLGPTATLNLTSQANGITDAVAGSRFDLYGMFTAGSSNGFANLNSIEGAVNLFGQNFTDTPGSGTLTISNTGALAANAGTTLKISGNVDNFGSISTDPGGNTLTVTGSVTNAGTFQLNGPGDKATMAGLTNNVGGYVDVEGGSTFQVNGNASNSGQIYTSFNGTGGNMFNVTGTLDNTNFIGLESTDTATIGGAVTNSGSFQMTGGSRATFTSTLLNTGTVDLENGSTLLVVLAADNFGTISTSANGGTGGNSVTFQNLLTNEAGAQLSVNGPGDGLTARGGMVNNGTVTGKNGSTIDPPFVNNLGTINIDGTSTFVVGTGKATGPGFIQLANGTFGEMINSATAFGQVDVAGSASLNGTLDILLQSGYNPAVGTSFTYLLLNPGQLSGTYATILNDIFNGGTEKWVVNYSDAGGFVQLTAASNNSTVPEPGTFLLLGSGLLSMAYGVRRRWLK